MAENIGRKIFHPKGKWKTYFSDIGLPEIYYYQNGKHKHKKLKGKTEMIDRFIRCMPKSKREALPAWICSATARIVLIASLISSLITLIICRAIVPQEPQTIEVVVEKEVPIYVSTPIETDTDAEAIAKVLYGMRANSKADLKLICWVILNRVDSERFPNTVKEVCEQKSQWVGYYSTNPITEELYEIALNEVTEWKTSCHRAIDANYLWFDWSTKGIMLRNDL